MTNDSIIFPNLGIYIPYVGRGIDIGSFHIAFYGIVIAIGMVLAIAYAEYNGRRHGFKKDSFIDMGIIGIIFGIVGARLYYVIFSWELYKDNLLGIFDIRSGGLGLYGGVIGGIIGGYLVARRKGIKFFPAADIAMPSILIGQIFGRWGNYFNREAFGGYSDGLFAMGIPVDAVRSTHDITEQMLANTINVDGITFITVHPTFLYECLWNIGVFVFIFILDRKVKLKDGTVFFIYLLFYGIGRFWIESLRTDQLLIAGAVPVSMVVAACCVIAAVVWFLVTWIRNRGRTEKP